VCTCHQGFALAKEHRTIDESEFESNDSSAYVHRHTCVEIDECLQVNGACAQTCTNLKGSHKCGCALNYVDSRGDGTICEGSWSEDPVVLLSYDEEMRQIRPNASDFAYTTLIEGQTYIAAIDIDALDRHVYWIDAYDRHLKRSYIPVSKSSLGHVQVLPSFQGVSGAPERHEASVIAVDWLAKNIYFSDLNAHAIKVAKSDGRYARTLLTTNTNAVQAIAVNPVKGLIYWINVYPEATIMSAWMNGENSKVLVDHDLDMPSGLTIDYHMNHRVFWCDERTGAIETMNFDGSDRHRIEQFHIRNPYKIDIFEGDLYWLSRRDGHVRKMDKFGRGAITTLAANLNLIEDVKVYHKFKYQSNGRLF
jgi:low density lipoprotein-related protein 2